MRRYWRPDLNHVFGWKPWEMGRLRSYELEAAVEYLNDMRRQ